MVEWLGVPPLLPVTVRVEVPPAVELAVLTVTVEVPDPVMEVGLNEAVTPLGNPEMLSGTLPVNPFRAVTVTV